MENLIIIKPQKSKSNSNSDTDSTYKRPVLRLDRNIFDRHKQEIKHRKLPTINSHFSDIEAIGLCNKMSISLARNLCSQINNPNSNRQLLIYQIHAIANKALKFSVEKCLRLFTSCEIFNLKIERLWKLKTYQNVIPDFPIISFSTDKTSFKIAFFLKRSRDNNQLKPDIRLFSFKTSEQIGFIDEDGYVMAKLEKFKPQLNLFLEAMVDNKFEIYSGVETGVCELCSHNLTHPTSLRRNWAHLCKKSQHRQNSL